MKEKQRLVSFSLPRTHELGCYSNSSRGIFLCECLELGDKVNGILDGGNGGGFLFWDFRVEFFFNGHDEFDSVQRIGTKIINEGGFWDDLVGIDSELLDNDVSDLTFKFGGHEKSSVGSCHERSGRGKGGGAGNKGKGDDRLEHDGSRSSGV